MMPSCGLRSLRFNAFLAALLLLLGPQVAWAVSPVYLAGTLNHDLVSEQPNAEATLLLGNWGFRATLQKGFRAFSTAPQGSQQQAYRLEGDPMFLSLLRPVATQRYQPRQGLPFDFMSAYAALGYSGDSLTLTRTTYSAQSSQVVAIEEQETLAVPQMLAQFGLLAGQSFAAIDLKVQYQWGRSPAGQLSDVERTFSAWGLVLGVGIGF